MDDNRKNTDNNNSGDALSWIIAFVALIAFWPVGLILLIRKVNQKSTASSSRKVKNDADSADTSENKSEPIKTPGHAPGATRRDKLMSVLLLIISIALFITGANTIAQSFSGEGTARLIMGVFYALGGAVSLLFRTNRLRRISRYKKYYAIIGKRRFMPIADIARTAGVSERAARRDIQAMIDDGIFGSGAYIDSELDGLVLSSKDAESVRQSVNQQYTRKHSEENQYMVIVMHLRELNNSIADISISAKVERIEELTAKIFRTVEENPQKLPHIRKFMDYYLPTTKKLLGSYVTMEKQGISGENISAAKENISRTLDTLASGFEQQLDRLFRVDVIDISADINVIENMMKLDGLSETEMKL